MKSEPPDSLLRLHALAEKQQELETVEEIVDRILAEGDKGDQLNRSNIPSSRG